jgi:phosphomannomutase
MVGGSGRTISELSAALDSEIGPYRSARVDLPLSPEERTRLGQIRAAPPDSLAGRRIASVNKLDGIKLIFEDGSWILVRESGTEPLARLYVEAHSEKDVQTIVDAGREMLKV